MSPGAAGRGTRCHHPQIGGFTNFCLSEDVKLPEFPMSKASWQEQLPFKLQTQHWECFGFAAESPKSEISPNSSCLTPAAPKHFRSGMGKQSSHCKGPPLLERHRSHSRPADNTRRCFQHHCTQGIAGDKAWHTRLWCQAPQGCTQLSLCHPCPSPSWHPRHPVGRKAGLAELSKLLTAHFLPAESRASQPRS